jgi:cytochrome bd-type quinol oxidase subunit 2
MSTLNGFGTLFYGWRHAEGEASTATKWLAAFYIPLIPLGRYRLKVLTNFHNERTQLKASPVGLLASRDDHFDIVDKTPIHWGEVLLTYARTFFGLPLLMFAPILIMWLLSTLGWLPRYESQADTPAWLSIAMIAFAVASLANVLCWPLWAIRKSRGMRIGG